MFFSFHPIEQFFFLYPIGQWILVFQKGLTAKFIVDASFLVNRGPIEQLVEPDPGLFFLAMSILEKAMPQNRRPPAATTKTFLISTPAIYKHIYYSKKLPYGVNLFILPYPDWRV